MSKEGFIPQYVVKGEPRNYHLKSRQGKRTIDLKYQKSSMVVVGNNAIIDPLALPLDSLPLDASYLPHIESKEAQELDVISVVARAKKKKTTKIRIKVFDTGHKPLQKDGFNFPSTAEELKETREAIEPKRNLIHHRTITREQLRLLQTAFHSPEQLEKSSPVRHEKQGLVAAGIIARGGDPNYRSSKNNP